MIVCMPVYDHVDMLDVCGPFEMFDWAGLEVDVVAADTTLLRFRSKGFRFEPTATFDSARQCDVLWVPGGDPAVLARMIYGPDQTYLEFLRRQASGARYVCSVCEGAMLLAGAGLLDGYQATTHWAFLNCFAERFPKVITAPGQPRFVLDRNRLTGGGISSGLDEALKLIELLLGTPAAEAVQRNTQYYPDPPVNAPPGVPPATCPMPGA
jgi:transcriptional regulator GlxA family with amidase domain